MSFSCKVVELWSCGEVYGFSGRDFVEDGMTGGGKRKEKRNKMLDFGFQM